MPSKGFIKIHKKTLKFGTTFFLWSWASKCFQWCRFCMKRWNKTISYGFHFHVGYRTNLLVLTKTVKSFTIDNWVRVHSRGRISQGTCVVAFLRYILLWLYNDRHGRCSLRIIKEQINWLEIHNFTKDQAHWHEISLCAGDRIFLPGKCPLEQNLCEKSPRQNRQNGKIILRRISQAESPWQDGKIILRKISPRQNRKIILRKTSKVKSSILKLPHVIQLYSTYGLS